MRTGLRVAVSPVVGLAVLGFALFGPAGTFDYWQAWVFISVFTLATITSGIYLAMTDPAALQRRLHAGPRAEARTVQKFIIIGAFLALFSMIELSALDHRFGWSVVPAAVSLIGDALVVIGLWLTTLVVVQNSYAAATVTVETGQKLATRGLYKLVRHPMYSANVVMMVGLPLALGSYWGLLLIPAGLLMLVLRILDEEKLLRQELGGYHEYTRQVRYRLVPYLW